MSSGKKTKRKSWRFRHSFAHELYLYISPLILAFVAAMIVVIYFTFANTIQTNFSQQTIATSEQAISNYEGYVNNVINVSMSIQGNLENTDVKTDKEQEKKYLDALMTTSLSSETPLTSTSFRKRKSSLRTGLTWRSKSLSSITSPQSRAPQLTPTSLSPTSFPPTATPTALSSKSITASPLSPTRSITRG